GCHRRPGRPPSDPPAPRRAAGRDGSAGAHPAGHAHPAAQGADFTHVSAPGSFRPPAAYNEPIRSYAPGAPERASLQARLADMAATQVEMPLVIGGKEVRT